MQQTYNKKKKQEPKPFPIGFKGRYRNQYLPPVGRIQNATREQMGAAGCIQAADEKMYVAIMRHTCNNPCNGCPAWAEKGPVCAAFQKYHVAWQRHQDALAAKAVANKEAITPHNATAGPLAVMSIAAIASTYGKSKSFVRNLKLLGKLTVEELTKEPAGESADAALQSAMG